MRIIAGELRGRRIGAPEGEGTRPMLDRVRESVFATLGDVVEGARVLDLYAGSGSLGLEALSRGATHARFVERGREALAALRANVEELGVRDRVRVFRGDALSPASWGEPGMPARFGLVFFDPPYRLLEAPNDRERHLRIVERLVAEHLEPGGVLVLHAPARELGALRLGRGSACDVRTYGTSAVAYVRRASAPARAADPDLRAGGDGAGARGA
jgi:16S rRNA (guanine966-N2)-methyltransferase